MGIYVILKTYIKTYINICLYFRVGSHLLHNTQYIFLFFFFFFSFLVIALISKNKSQASCMTAAKVKYELYRRHTVSCMYIKGLFYKGAIQKTLYTVCTYMHLNFAYMWHIYTYTACSVYIIIYLQIYCIQVLYAHIS